MSPERWQQIERLFQSALELAPDERARFLAQACAGDLALLNEVKSLMAADQLPEGLIDAPVFKAAAELIAASQAEDESMIGQHIGPYLINCRIGQGGMGVVYLATRDDGQYEKKVAIKLMSPDLDTEEVMGRFLDERQILASLDHPNIAHLLDGGTINEGTPYFVMEYIKGLPIDEYCDSRGLGIYERLKLFQRVCSAVAHAHRNHIVHRDIKPANILVTTEGDPKVLDFGIAKLLTSDGPPNTLYTTVTTHRLLTPGYASPEQVRGELVSTSSDIYSLGVVLYELLTGRSPYRIKGRLPYEIARAICEEVPEKPSVALVRIAGIIGNGATESQPMAKPLSESWGSKPVSWRRLLEGHLDKISLKALHKKPEERYLTVEHFSEDIRLYLNGSPVTAGREGFANRRVKFIRNKTAVSVAIVMILMVGIVFSLWYSGITTKQQRDAEAREVVAEPSNAENHGDYVLIPNNPRLNPSSAITVEAWFAARHTEEHQFLVSKFSNNDGPAGSPPNDSYALYIRPSGKLVWQVDTITEGRVKDILLEIAPPQPVWDGKFHHAVGTYDSNAQTMTLYLDGYPLTGHLQGTLPKLGPIVATSTDILLGAGLNNKIHTHFLRGLLDEVRIYDRALSPEEVRQLASSDALVLPGVIASWRGEGNAKDAVGGSDGILMGHARFGPGKVGQAFRFGVD